MASLDIARLHGRCGILTACLCDPLSQLINKIIGLNEEDPNAVGFYYESEIHGVSKYTIILFNIYDNNPVPWLRLEYTIDLLLSSPFVIKITFHPLVTDQSDSSSSITMTRKSDMRPMDKLEEMFRVIVIETISANATNIRDKNVSYTTLLMKAVGVTNDETNILASKLITGYNLVNRVLLALMNIRETDSVKITTSIVPCPLLKKSSTINVKEIASKEIASEEEMKFVIEETRREITKLAAIFVDLYTSHEIFRSNALSMRTNGKSSINLENLFTREAELVSHIIGSLQNGTLDNATLNEIIRDLANERFSLGNYQNIPISTEPASTVQITNDNMLCTFQHSSAQISTDPLRNLGIYLSHIADSFDSSEVLTIDLGQIITTYNNVIHDTDLNEIQIPHLGGLHTISRGAVITLPNHKAIKKTKLPISIPVAMYEGNLVSLTEAQLIDILVYIDSLRDSDGVGDTRFANLQNEITHELAHRRSVI